MCITPLTLTRPRDEWITSINYPTVTRKVPCGKCYKCLKNRRNSWSFRMYYEAQRATSAAFMTLTYGVNPSQGFRKSPYFGEDPPLRGNGMFERYSLDPDHLRKFMMRLRKEDWRIKKLNNEPLNKENRIKYYAVGEYGTTFHRPHYHLILYNVSRSLLARSLYVSESIWKKGMVDIASCNIATINYVIGYIVQGVWKPDDAEDYRVPPFCRMSKGLGSNYINEQRLKYHQDRLEDWVYHPSGFKMSIPRYLRDQIFNLEQKKILQLAKEEELSMNWEEFINHDYKQQICQDQEKIRRAQARLKKSSIL